MLHPGFSSQNVAAGEHHLAITLYVTDACNQCSTEPCYKSQRVNNSTGTDGPQSCRIATASDKPTVSLLLSPLLLLLLDTLAHAWHPPEEHHKPLRQRQQQGSRQVSTDARLHSCRDQYYAILLPTTGWGY
jgi:hypothetical protein